MADTFKTREELMHEAFQLSPHLIPMELEGIRKDPKATLTTYLIDSDFDSTVRGMLTYRNIQEWDMTDLRSFLEEESDSDRYLDLIRVWNAIRLMTRGELSRLLMSYSLCPIHFCDWASCFDDDDPECDQIRQAFPNEHDT